MQKMKATNGNDTTPNANLPNGMRNVECLPVSLSSSYRWFIFTAFDCSTLFCKKKQFFFFHSQQTNKLRRKNGCVCVFLSLFHWKWINILWHEWPPLCQITITVAPVTQSFEFVMNYYTWFITFNWPKFIIQNRIRWNIIRTAYTPRSGQFSWHLFVYLHWHVQHSRCQTDIVKWACVSLVLWDRFWSGVTKLGHRILRQIWLPF